MDIHKMARLTPVRRAEVVAAVQAGVPVAAVARQQGVSRQTVYRWVRRGLGAVGDRSSRPPRSPRALPRPVRRRIQRQWQQGVSSPAIARTLGLPLSTVVHGQRRLGLARRPGPPPAPVVRDERSRPGELVHLDVKKLGRIGRVGHRIHGDRRQAVAGIGWEYVHVAIDDHSRVAYVDVLADETGRTTAGFVQRALAPYLRFCSTSRTHTTPGWQTPRQGSRRL